MLVSNDLIFFFRLVVRPSPFCEANLPPPEFWEENCRSSGRVTGAKKINTVPHSRRNSRDLPDREPEAAVRSGRRRRRREPHPQRGDHQRQAHRLHGQCAEAVLQPIRGEKEEGRKEARCFFSKSTSIRKIRPDSSTQHTNTTTTYYYYYYFYCYEEEEGKKSPSSSSCPAYLG